MLVAPARFGNFALAFRYGGKSFLVPVKHQPVGAVADGMGGNLNAVAQGLLENRHDIVFFDQKKPRVARVVRVRCQ